MKSKEFISTHKKKILFFFILILFLFTLINIVFFVGPGSIVEFLGVENTYAVIFLIAIFGGVSAFTSTSFYIMFFTFLVGGANPIPLAIIGGAGLTIGDMLFYYLGSKGRDLTQETKYDTYIEKISKMVEKYSTQIVYLFIYLYTSFSPFPKDILSIAFGLLHYNIKILFTAMLFGNITHCFVMVLFFSFFVF